MDVLRSDKECQDINYKVKNHKFYNKNNYGIHLLNLIYLILNKNINMFLKYQCYYHI